MIGIQHETVILAVDHHRDRPLIDRIAALGADAGAPVFIEEGLQLADLALEVGRRIAGQRDLAPHHGIGCRSGDFAVSHGASA